MLVNPRHFSCFNHPAVAQDGDAIAVREHFEEPV
jgi:hypothetical protein